MKTKTAKVVYMPVPTGINQERMIDHKRDSKN